MEAWPGMHAVHPRLVAVAVNTIFTPGPPTQDPLALSGDSAVGGGEDKKRSFEQLTVEEGQVGELRRVGCCKRVGAQPCPDR
jgi:hypothetical protein